MRLRAALAAALLLGVACAKPHPVPPQYQPAASVLELVATLRRHLMDDTYRFEPARDFSGRNVYRASLIRLESLERLHAESLRAGHFDDVVAFSKGRALERLRAYDLAAASHRRAAERDGPLREEALRAAALNDAIAQAVQLGFEPGRPPIGDPEPPVVPPDADAAIAAFDQRVGLLEAQTEAAAGTPLSFVLQEEVERSDEARARYFVARRLLDPGGEVRAMSELQRVTTRHRDSKNRNRHVLELADLYATIAQEYVRERPPESLWFDPASFQELVDSATQLYEAIANQDGTPEKLEAARRLEAFLAFTLRVDRDRFTP